jgi:hypothetical protein
MLAEGGALLDYLGSNHVFRLALIVAGCWYSSSAAAGAASAASLAALAVDLPQHADEHRSERSVLLVVDQELGEGPRLGVRLWSTVMRGDEVALLLED